MREFNAFKLRKFLSDKCNQKVEKLAKDSKNGFSFKPNLLSDIKKYEDIICEITFYKF